MRAETNLRARAVRLTREALELLRSRLIQKFEESGSRKKLTREVSAELLGLSVGTTGRLLAGSGVDRTTLVLAFRNLGLEWDESFCELTHKEPANQIGEDQPTESSEPTEIPTTVTPAVTADSESRRLVSSRTLVLATLGVIVIGSGIAFAISQASAASEKIRLGRQLTFAINQGQSEFQSSRYAEASQYAKQAISLARQIDSAGNLSAALRLAGDVAAAQGALADAKDDYERALALHSALAQDRTYPAMYEALGDVKTRMKDYSGAKSDLQASLDGYRKFEDPVGVAMACRDLGTIEDELGNYQEAERWFKTSLESISGLAKWDIVADVHSRQARILLKKGRISEARNLVVGSLEYWKKQNHARWIAASLLQLGEIELAGKEFPRAIELLGESKKVFSEVGDRARTELAEKRLNEAVSGQGMLHGKE